LEASHDQTSKNTSDSRSPAAYSFLPACGQAKLNITAKLNCTSINRLYLPEYPKTTKQVSLGMEKRQVLWWTFGFMDVDLPRVLSHDDEHPGQIQAQGLKVHREFKSGSRKKTSHGFLKKV